MSDTIAIILAIFGFVGFKKMDGKDANKKMENLGKLPGSFLKGLTDL